MYEIGEGTVLKIIGSLNPLNNFVKVSSRMDELVDESVTFIAASYGSHDRTNRSAARYDIWTSKMANNKLTTAPQLKTIPPTTEAFGEHVRRVHFQVAIGAQLFSKIHLFSIIIVLGGHWMKHRNHLTPYHFLLLYYLHPRTCYS